MTYLKATLCLLFLVGGWLSFLPSSSAATPQMWYVSKVGSDVNDCRTRNLPCATIQVVLDNPDFSAGDTIFVESGQYYYEPTNGRILHLNQDAILSGGWNTQFTEVLTTPSSIIGYGYTGILIEAQTSVTLTHIIATGGEYQPAVSIPLLADQVLEVPQVALSQAGIKNNGNLILLNSGGYGYYGYGIDNAGTITLTNSFSGASFGIGILNNAQMRMQDSKIEYPEVEYGCAAIENHGVLQFESSIIKGGAVRFGTGGLCNYGDATIINSLLSGNHANGPYPDDAVGAIANYGTLTVTNSAIFGNTGMFESASGIYNTGELYLANTSIAGNGDDLDLVSVSGNVYTRNSLIENCKGTVTSDGYNLLAQSKGCDWHGAIGDLFDQNPFVTNLFQPRLGSPLINHGNPDGCEAWDGTHLDTDKDGSPRWQVCDIGVYEYIPSSGQIFTRHLPFVERAIME